MPRVQESLGNQCEVRHNVVRCSTCEDTIFFGGCSCTLIEPDTLLFDPFGDYESNAFDDLE